MMARLGDAQAMVYAEPNRMSVVVTDLLHGEDLQVTDHVANGGGEWVAVVLPDGRQGYVPAETGLEQVAVVELDGDATIRVEPSEAAPALVAYGAGARLWRLGATVKDGRAWLEVTDADGHRGFIPGKTQLEDASPRPSDQALRAPQAPRLSQQAVQAAEAATAQGKRNMLIGGLWCVGGLAVTIYTYSAASGGGTYVVAWGAILFGGFQFLKGLAQYFGAGW